MRVILNFLLTFITMSLVLACTKKRDDQFYQGQGNELRTYGELDGQTFSLQTGEIISEATKTASEKIVIEGSVEGIRSLPLVSYKTNATLLGDDIPFRGRPYTRYEIRYRILNRFLRVEKIAPKDHIPTDEMTYATKEPDGRYAVPLVGYQVSYYRIENQLNSDNEPTHLIIEIPERTPTKASHVRVDHLNRQVFSALDKIDVYPAEYFDGEWYFSETVVSTSEDQTTVMVGGTASVYDASFNPASKIRFMKEKDQLRGVNLNIDERLKEIYKDDRLNYKSVIAIPVEWKSYRLSLDGSGDALIEETNDDIKWDQREYMELKFEETLTVVESLSSYLLKLTGGRKLIDLRFAEDYFSYALLDIDSGKIVRYSFLRSVKDDDFKPRTYPRITRKDFGYFTSSWNEIYNYEMYRLADIEEHTYLNRFNPNEDIVFYITNNSPEDKMLIRVAQKAAQYWDKTFQLAGARSRVRFDASKRVDLADLRYNAINYIDGLSSGSGLLGYGPSLSDPFTGEIIMATSNMHVTNFRSSIVNQLRLYIRQQLGFYEAAIIDRPDVMFNYLGDFESRPTQIFNPAHYQFLKEADGTIKETSYLIPDYLSRDASGFREISVNSFSPESVFSKLVTYIDKGPTPDSAFELAERYNRILKEKPALANFATHADRENFRTIMSDAIEKRCPELARYAESLKQRPQDFTTDDELKAMAPCLEKFLEEKLLATLVHEMGHNFGLAHNFKASFDEANFWTEEELNRYYGLKLAEGEAPRSASTMDYIPLEHDRLVTPGKYDVAAIHFGYVDNKKANPIQIEISGKPLYCDDADANLGRDPFCMRHDFGTTALEIATNYIKSVQQNLKVFRYRFDRATAPRAAASNVSHMANLKRLYDHWRFILRDFVGTKAGYLQGLYDPLDIASARRYQSNVLDRMKNSRDFAEDYEQFYPVRNVAYGFLKNVALLPDALCMYQDGEEQLQWIPLSTVRDEIKAFVGRDKMVTSCHDDIVVEFLANRYSGEFLDQIGQPVEDFQFSLDVIDLRYTDMDVVGVTTERLFAARYLGIRSSGTLAHLDSNIQPSMLDEPDLRWDMTNSILTRIVAGVDLGENVNGSVLTQEMMGSQYDELWPLIKTQRSIDGLLDESDRPGSLIAEVYSNDWQVTRLLYDYLYVSGSVPGSSSETSKRRDPLRSIPLRVSSEITSDIVDYVAISSMGSAGQFSYIGARANNVFTLFLIDELKSTQFRKDNMDLILAERGNIGSAIQNILNAIPPTSPDGESGGVTTVNDYKNFIRALITEINAAGPDSLMTRLLIDMFRVELTIYQNSFSRLGQDAATLRAEVARLERLLGTGVDEAGVQITPERRLIIQSEINGLKTQIGLRDAGMAITDYAELVEFIDQKFMGGRLPPRQVLRREPIARRFQESTKKGSALELDAKVTLLTEALLTSLRYN